MGSLALHGINIKGPKEDYQNLSTGAVPLITSYSSTDLVFMRTVSDYITMTLVPVFLFLKVIKHHFCNRVKYNK